MTTTQSSTEGATRYVAPSGASDLRPWFTYERISKVGKGAHIGMDNQHAENLAYLHSWAGSDIQVVDWRDNGSGWDEDHWRADFEAMLKALEQGQAAGVIAWHSDRFTRQPEQLERIIKAVRKGGTQLHTRLGGWHHDPTFIRIEMALAAKESETKSERAKLKMGELAAKGKWHGGPRLYGLNAKRTGLVADEARHMRWAARQLIAGKSLNAIAKELAERGATTVQGKLWKGSNLGTYLKRPAVAGLREAHGEIVGEAAWPAVRPMATWQAVLLLLSDPSRRVSHSQARKYLLSGIARCGTCGKPMRGKSNNSKGLPAAYQCATQQGGCAYRRVDMTDARVRAMVVARLAEIDVRGALALPDDMSQAQALEQAIAELEGRLEGLVSMHLAGTLTAAQLASGTAEGKAKLAQLRAELAALELERQRPVAALEGLAGMANAAELFDALDLDRQRAVVAQLCTVTIQPTGIHGRGRSLFDRRLIQVDWK